MSGSGTERGGEVLCVVPGSEEERHPVVLALADAGVPMEVVGDPYRAMARLGRSDPRGWCAVLVAIDALDPSELEFFELAGRFHRDVPVYVLAPSVTWPRVQAAMASGAKGPVWSDTVATVVGSLIERARDAGVVVAPEPAPRHVTSDRADEIPGAEPPADRGGADAQPPSPAGAQSTTGQGERSGKVRVPWRTYANTPRRRPPQPAQEAETQTAASELEPPLLTPEEIEALIGDGDPVADEPGRRSETP